jgi:hypothetical protein
MTSDIGRDDVLNGLTPTMERCLAAVTAEQGQPAKTLPGGVNTVWALMRRALVETDSDQKTWRVFELLDGARPIREVVIQRPRHYAPPLAVVA